MRIHDVMVTLRSDMPTWPGEQGPHVEPLKRIARGDSSNVSLVTFGDHTGTHVDPPVHFVEGANAIDQLPVDALVGPCRVIAYDEEDHISAKWLASANVPRGTERVLFKTRNSELWRDAGHAFQQDFIALDETAAHWLVESGVKLVGIDYLSIEPFGSGKIGHPVHHALLRAQVVIIEGLDLRDVAAGAYELFCGPLKIAGGTGSPARVFLVER
ncbi:MAG: cyclase family protein [Chloroflexota bacterium]|nr:cyclase family protein [Chloroflexota bacterium]MDE3194600.1 cyclase family protein [Chloroflexota bacterium]